jgi:RNA polymerase sigma-70 factor (ECF subfamily)
MPSLSDEDVMARVQKGDLEHAGLLFERHHAALYRFFVHTTQERAASQDLTQDVFVRLFTYRTSYQHGAPVRPWLHRIARNVLADHWRRPQRASVSLDDEATASGLPSPVSTLERRDAQDQLDAALARLDPAQRELLVHSHVSDLSYPEIAEIYDITVNAARVRVCRALRALRAVYMQHEVRDDLS